MLPQCTEQDRSGRYTPHLTVARLRPGAPVPDVVSQLLPWYLNGTLDEEEAREVEAYLERSSEARAELDELRVLQRAVVSVGMMPIRTCMVSRAMQ